MSISAGSALAGKASVRHQDFLDDGSSLLGLELLPGCEEEESIGPDNCWTLRLPGAANDYAFKYYDRLRRIDAYIQEHFEGKISLGDAAQVAALERSYFCRYFHEKVGMSFTQYLQRVRLRNCIDILLQGDSSITEACYQSGFGDLRHFERTFRKWTDLSPTDFRSLAVP
ncbi:MAG TPA: helix-turn-helix domain-containing protein [Acidobacteriota bacterium]|nr:helix-turn-helix domain-containing protein [Acidobacteriota bacterium]